MSAQQRAVFDQAVKEFRAQAAQPHPLPNREWLSDAVGSTESEAGTGAEAEAEAVAPFDVARLTAMTHVSHTRLRERLYELFKHTDFQAPPDESLHAERARVMRMWAHVARLGFLECSLSANTPEGRARYEAVIESCGLVSHSLDIKMSVHYGLFGATVLLLGDDAQAQKWLPKIERCEMLGCFALTELGHGSNARGIETLAEYDVSRREFLIHTPVDAAQKYWIGGAAVTARWTVAFAQLRLGDVSHGIHAFLVRIRSDGGDLMPGVSIADCGHKCGLNGVDNGRIWFDHVRVPHEHLLRRHSQVSLDGVYSSRFKSPDERFGASLASLSGGRVSVAAGCLNQAKIGLTIAIRYSLSRRAFGPPGEEETFLIDYPGHQHRLIPALASTYVMQFVLNKLKHKWHNQQLGKELHTWSAGFKALMTWHSLDTLQEAREACGGQGYKSENRIGPIKTSHDVALTYEGDNHILLQAVTKTMLADFLRGVKTGKFNAHFDYLNDRAALLSEDLSETPVTSARFVQTVLRRREAALFARLADVLEKRMRGGESSLAAFNAEAVLVEDAARAHVELLMADLFEQTLAELHAAGPADGAIADVLAVCGQLHNAATIDKQAVFLRCRALSAYDAQRVHDAVLPLCAALRPNVLHLVDALGIPPHLLAPIAFDYVAHNNLARI